MSNLIQLIESRPIDKLSPLTEEQLRIVASYYERLVSGESVMDEFVALTNQRGYPETEEFYHLLGEFAQEYKDTPYVSTELIETDYIPTITAAKLSKANGKFNDLAEQSAKVSLAKIIAANEKAAHLVEREIDKCGTADPISLGKLKIQSENIFNLVKQLKTLREGEVSNERGTTVEDKDSV